MARKITLEIVREEAEKRGYTLLSTAYKNCSTKLEFVCPNGHEYFSDWNNFCRGKGCRKGICSKKRKSIENVKSEFSDYGYVLLEDEYVDSKTSMKVKCPNGHIVCMTRINFVHHGKRCIKCYEESSRITIDKVRNEFERVGYTLLSNEYINNYTYLDYICDRGHLNKSTWCNFNKGKRCKYCAAENRIVDETVVKKELREFEYRLIKGTYIMAKESFGVICPKGHKTTMYLYNFRRGNRCGVCDLGNKTSKSEKEILAFVKSIYSGEIVDNTRKIIYPYELDIFIPSKNLAIEYCGLYWHTNLHGKNKNYHYNKYKRCLDKGIRLITIFEDEYLNNTQDVLNKIRSIVLVPTKPIFVSVDNKIVSDLCWDWHLSSEYYNGLGYKKERETNPLLYKTIEVKKHNNVVYGNVWDCGRIIYRKAK